MFQDTNDLYLNTIISVLSISFAWKFQHFKLVSTLEPVSLWSLEYETMNDETR